MTNANGYPSAATLRKIAKWPVTTKEDLDALIKFVESEWSYYCFQRDGKLLSFSTGGWSGNEEIIGALQKNTLFWSCFWMRSERGGHYWFDLNAVKWGKSDAK